MSDGDCCMVCCCFCSIFSLCNTTVGTHPFCFPRSCFKCRRSKFDDDEFIDEVVKDNERRRTVERGDPEAMYHVKQPEPVAQMDTQYPPRRPISHLHQEQQQMHKPQSEAPARHGSLENGGRREEN